VVSQGQLTNAADFGALVVTYRNGAPVRLRDLGRVVDSVQDTKQASWYNGERAIVLAISAAARDEHGAVAERVKAEVDQLRPFSLRQLRWPPFMTAPRRSRRRSRTSSSPCSWPCVSSSLVIFLFLRNLRATLIPSLACPMSLIGTFSVMYLLGFSLDNLSLMALTLAAALWWTTPSWCSRTLSDTSSRESR